MDHYNIYNLIHDSDMLGRINTKEIISAHAIFYGFHFKSEKINQALGLRITSNGTIFEGITNTKIGKSFGRLIQDSELTEEFDGYLNKLRAKKDNTLNDDVNNENKISDINKIGAKDNESSNYESFL